MKFTWKTEAWSILILVISFIGAIYFYQHFPARVTSHWDFGGRPNGYLGRFWGAFMFPLILLGIYLMFLAIPYLDPRRARYENFAPVYHIFRNLILTALFCVFLITGIFNLGYHIDVAHSISIIIGLMIIILGNYMGKIRSNWFMGVRTPWTLSSETVWNKTQRFAGRLMMLFGLIIIVSPFLAPAWGIGLFIAGAVLVAIGSIVYSYLEFQKELRNKNK